MTNDTTLQKYNTLNLIFQIFFLIVSYTFHKPTNYLCIYENQKNLNVNNMWLIQNKQKYMYLSLIII